SAMVRRRGSSSGSPSNRTVPATSEERGTAVGRTCPSPPHLVKCDSRRSGGRPGSGDRCRPCVGRADRPKGPSGWVDPMPEHRDEDGAIWAGEDRFRTAFAHAAVGMAVTDADGRFLEANPAYCRIVGYSDEELCRLDFGSLTHPDDR